VDGREKGEPAGPDDRGRAGDGAADGQAGPAGGER
jgi:hypothetical protein